MKKNRLISPYFLAFIFVSLFGVWGLFAPSSVLAQNTAICNNYDGAQREACLDAADKARAQNDAEDAAKKDAEDRAASQNSNNNAKTSTPHPATVRKCAGGSFFGFPTWYKYLPGGKTCNPALEHITDIWLIALAVVEILLRVAILAAIVYVLIGGFKYITSAANPEKTTVAKNTVLDALIGLVIAVSATAVVSFIGRQF